MTSAAKFPAASQCLLPSADTCRRNIQLKAGGLLLKLQCNMEKAAAGACGTCAGPGADGCPLRPRLLLYAGHDTNIFGLLTALRYTPTAWPDYLSHLEFELWEAARPAGASAATAASAVGGGGDKDGGRWLVRVVFNNQVVPLGGRETLPLAEYEQFMAPYTLQPGEEGAICGVKGSGGGGSEKKGKSGGDDGDGD
jgi:hypothetical protein